MTIATKKLIDYLKIRTVHPVPDYGNMDQNLYSFEKQLIVMEK